MSRLRFLSASIILPLLIPPTVFTFCALAKGMPLAETLSAMIEQYMTRRQNLLICGAVGFFPVLLLFAGLWLHRRAGGDANTRRIMAWSGLVPVVLILVWVNLQFWPLFLPKRVYPGFPHGLEFVIGPGLFAPIGMLVGVGLGWWVARRPG